MLRESGNVNQYRVEKLAPDVKEKTPTLRTKAEALIWVCVAIASWYIFAPYDRTIRRGHYVAFFLWSGLALLAISAGLFAHLSLIFARHPSENATRSHPYLVYGTIATSFGMTMCLIIGLWPALTVFGPVFLFLNAMGFIHIFPLIPDWGRWLSSGRTRKPNRL
eukprot:ANDGO_03214.mRNA.1 hypothetical protein